MDDTTSSDQESRDAGNRKFWESLNETLALALEMVHEQAREHGINPDDIKTEALPATTSGSDPCSIAAKEYASLVDNWFVTNKDLFDGEEKALSLKAELKIPDYNPLADYAELKDAVQIIRWFQSVIYVKLARANCGIVPELDDPQADSNGSAKVALLGIERSISAWNILYKRLEDGRDSALDILLHLARLVKQTEKTYPLARSFIRPGFDEA